MTSTRSFPMPRHFEIGDYVTCGTDPTPYEAAHFRWTIHGWKVAVYHNPPTGHVTYVDPSSVQFAFRTDRAPDLQKP